MFMVFYPVTIVAANLIFATPAGPSFLRITGFPTESLAFDTSFTFGYWALLLMPIVAVPLMVPLFKRILTPVVSKLASTVPDFTKTEYSAIATVFYAIAAWTFWQAGAMELAASAHNAVAAVEVRFELQERMHFLVKVIIHAILPFLACYAVAAAFRIGGRFWISIALINTMAVTFLLVGVNMKWPALLFMIALVVATFLFARKYPYIKAAAGVVFLVGFYLVLSTYVFRAILPESEPIISATQTPEDLPPQSAPSTLPAVPPENTPTVHPFEYANDLVRSSLKLAPQLFAHAVNRMAIAYPYYYHVFTKEGKVCGGLVDQAKTSENVRCRPSWLVYTRIFGKDQFEGRGTAPAAPHITGYALGGWPVAILGVIGICLVLAAFLAIPLYTSIMMSAFAVVGATVGYHLSQIPGEGVIFYDHGFLWPIALVFVFACYRQLLRYLNLTRKNKASSFKASTDGSGRSV